MTPLRNKMIEAMTVRGFSLRTHESYLQAVQGLTKYYHRSPDTLTPGQIQRYFTYLAVERGLAWSSCRLAFHGIRFLFLQVLQRPGFDMDIPMPKRKEQIPELLNHSEVAAILSACKNPKHRLMLNLCYGCGLRVNELTHLRVSDIDGERGLLRIEQGKGGRDRLLPLGPTLLEQLRDYWRHYHPEAWLFPSPLLNQPLNASAIQKVFVRVKREAGWRNREASIACDTPMPPTSWKPVSRSIDSNTCWGIRTCTPHCATSTGFPAKMRGAALTT